VGAAAGDAGGCWQNWPALPGETYRFSAWFWADDGNPYGRGILPVAA
jgi:hypothetical protein